MDDQSKRKISVRLEIDFVDQFAEFVGKIFGPAAKNIGEVLGDQTALWKLKNGLRIRDKVEKLRRERNIPEAAVADMRIGVPLLEHAIKEDNDKLQDMWANLLASALLKSEILFAERSFIEIINSINPPEAGLLCELYEKYTDFFNDNKEVGEGLIISYTEASIQAWYQFRNLERLGIIKIGKVGPIIAVQQSIVMIDVKAGKSKADGLFSFSVFFTSYGYRFMRMVTGKPIHILKNGAEIAIVDIDSFFREYEDDRMRTFINGVANEFKKANEPKRKKREG